MESTEKVKNQDSDCLLCKSEEGSVRSVYITYAVIAAIVIAFQAFIFARHLINPFQIAIVAVCLITIIYYALRTREDAHDWLHLYENHFETKNGSFSYDAIRDCHVTKDQITLKLNRRTTFYVTNSNELAKVIRRQKSRQRMKSRKHRASDQ